MNFSIDPTNVWAGIIAFAVFAYVVMDGFDLGIGILFSRIPEGQERDTHAGGRRKLPLRILARANPHRPPGAAAPGEIRQRLERRAGAAAVIDERTERARADVLGTDEAQPVEALGGG